VQPNTSIDWSVKREIVQENSVTTSALLNLDCFICWSLRLKSPWFPAFPWQDSVQQVYFTTSLLPWNCCFINLFRTVILQNKKNQSRTNPCFEEDESRKLLYQPIWKKMRISTIFRYLWPWFTTMNVREKFRDFILQSCVQFISCQCAQMHEKISFWTIL
jgi:hypothetical protein